ncbi:MAG: tRNA 2-thiocytidine(32) synthetase TtcA [Clostridiales bacterium]|nr:tRNA 2-thiocytidine(32) synthetase TtcA [Clostridiales bacterium]
MKKTLGCLRRADQDFKLIENGDRIAVGVSGGKDSMLLIKAMSLYRLFSKKEISITAVNVGMGLGFDPAPIKAYCDEIGVEFAFEDARLLEVVQAATKTPDKPSCALCAKLRRGALNSTAVKLGCNKVALAHHRDDVLETFLMSMFYEGRLNTLSPISYLSRQQITVIRPFVYLPEKHIIGAVRREQLPIVPSVCPYDGYTNRQRMKDLIKDLRHMVPRADEMMFFALSNIEGYNLWDKAKLFGTDGKIEEEE